MFANQRYQEQATAELRRLGLGPFRESRADGPHDDAADPSLSAVPAE
jgi:hypothetical protein